MSCFKVIEGGLLSLIQDNGRFGLCHKGLTQSGSMDEYAYRVANNLLGNPHNTNCIEITLGGLKLECDDACTISVCGANAKFTINNQTADIWRTHNLHQGDILEFKFATSGVRVYLCVKGGFNIPQELGSCATTIKEGIGGLNGKSLQKGDIINFFPHAIQKEHRLHKADFIPQYTQNLKLRVILGYQDGYFDPDEVEKFFSQTYTISSENNRMGYKLKSDPIHCKIDGIISEGISFGAIQIPKDGQPIILLKDRQTIGGYPKIGSVLPIDCFKLAQMRMGNHVTFEPISIDLAQEKMKLFYESLGY
ncbi:biotin-dependent carboxyltransferase family protein [Sulfurospirillum sp. 1612]|uniref:5-oxoprolinase subunit C family protein n=1 Tax=Sulfurospirillum sp. 1612 TaxID=3094835 RepID=UPI002F9539F0